MSTQIKYKTKEIWPMAYEGMGTCCRNLKKKKRWFLAKGQGRENQDCL